MKFIIAFALLAAASADVSHLPKTYLPPVHSGAGVSFAPAFVQNTHSAPAVHHASVQQQQHHHHHHVAPAAVNEYLPPVQETYTGPAVQTPIHRPSVSYSAPALAPVSHSAPAVHQQAYSGQSVHHSGHAVHSHQYSAPETGYLPPVVQQTYTAPSVSYSSGSGVDTQYGSNGGYIYRKK